MAKKYLLLLLGAFLIGLSPIYVRLSELGPVATAFYRAAFSIPIFIVLDYLRPQTALIVKPSIAAQRRWLLLFSLGFIYALNLITWHWSLQYIPVGKSTLLANLSVIFVIPLGWLLFGRPMHIAALFYAVGAFGGVVLLFWGDFNDFANLRGTFWGIVSAVCYAMYLLIASQLRTSMNTISQMTWTCVFTALCVWPFVLWQGESLVIITLYGLAILLGLSITSQVMGQGLIAYTLAYITPSHATLILLLQPVVATVAGWLLFAEVLTLIQVLGALVIMCFIYFSKNLKSLS